jgi:two-component system alkaline phosphatase synthesis response regulator PhoP
MAKKILVIEDDPATSRLVDYSLRHEGYEVIRAFNGLEGLRKAKDESPDLVILDVMLPGLDGFEICHRLREDAATAPLPILMLSAKAQEIDKNTGLKVGADDYLSKPAAPADIVSRVGRLLSREKGAARPREQMSGK